MNKQTAEWAAPKGFAAAGIHAGIRKNKSCKDLALIKSDVPCSASAMYTQNKVAGAPIIVTKENLADGKATALICNSGNANTCNADGKEVAEQMCKLTAKALGLAKEDIIVASTGVIGVPLSIKPIADSMDKLVAALNDTDGHDAAKAIMTTDTVAKEMAVKFSLGGKTCTIGAIAKGSGMIHPNMATMLSFITTDTAISEQMLAAALKDAVAVSYNMVSVDGDTSTNDMVSIMANGLAGNEPISQDNADYKAFSEALKSICIEMAKMIAKDGEGASKLLECVVSNGPDQQLVKDIAKSVITSSLTKAAMFGADANWGRVTLRYRLYRG